MNRLLTFAVLMAAWMVFSGKFDAFHVTLGVLSAAFVTVFSGDLMIQNRAMTLGDRGREAVRVTGYLVWLLKEIVLANLHVLGLALLPGAREEIDPRIIRFKTKLKTDWARFVFANSITLTPGTVTISIEGDEFAVHAISSKTADSLPGEMENRVAAAFEPESRNR